MRELLVIRLEDFTGGRNTTVSEPRVAENESADELNIRSRPVGVIARRSGWQRYILDNFGNYPAVPTGLHKLYRSRDSDHVLYVYVPPNLWACYQDGSRQIVKNDFKANTFCDFATMKDMAYGTNYRDLPFRAWADQVKNAELTVPTVIPYYWHYTDQAGQQFQFPENPYGAGTQLAYLDTEGKAPWGGVAYRFRAYYGKDLGESAWGRYFVPGLKAGVSTPQYWETFWYGEDSQVGSTPDPPHTILLGLADIALPAGAESLHIYRTQKLVDVPDTTVSDLVRCNRERPSREQIANAPYYFLDEVNPSDYTLAAYRDAKSDDDLGELADPNPVLHQYARYVEEHHDRLFYAGINERWLDRLSKKELDNDGNANSYGNNTVHPSHEGTIFWYTEGPVAPNRLYCTYAYRPSAMEGFIDIAAEDGDVITAIKSLGPLLVIFKRRHIYTLLGVSFGDFVVRVAESNVGCIAPRSVAKHGDALIFYSGTDVYRFDGSQAVPIGTKVRLELQAIEPALKPLAAGVVYRDTYLLSIPEIV